MPATRRSAWNRQPEQAHPQGRQEPFTLQTLPAEDFPLVQEAANFGPAFSVPQKTLKTCSARCTFAMAVHDIRYYLNGILFVAEGKTLSWWPPTATAWRFARPRSTSKCPSRKSSCRARPCWNCSACCQGRRRAQIEMRFANNQAKFSFGGMEFVTKLVEGKFPDYNRVIPKNHKNSITLGRARCWPACSAPPS
jgi:DNA polymerase-3 subunit beta